MTKTADFWLAVAENISGDQLDHQLLGKQKFSSGTSPSPGHFRQKIKKRHIKLVSTLLWVKTQKRRFSQKNTKNAG